MGITSIPDAIADLAEAQKAYREARDAYEGYSWGWAGYDLKRRVDQAEDALKESLDSYVDERIRLALKAAGIAVPDVEEEEN